MPPLPEMIIAVLAPVAGLFSATVWGRAQVLLVGTILCRPHTVAAALRVMGLGQELRFERLLSGVESGALVGLAGSQNGLVLAIIFSFYSR